MYEKSLEQLIDAVIADGIITEQERKVVYKKAASLGIDQDEIEVYLEGRLDAHNNISGHKVSTKHGELKTCPNCGASIGSFETKCTECGFEFKHTEAVKSMAHFVKKLNATKDTEKKCELIATYPIPNDRESLLEFISVSIPNSKDARGAFSKGFPRWFMIGCASLIILAIFYCIQYDIEAPILVGIPTALIFAYFANRLGGNNSIAKAWNTKTEAALNKLKLASQNSTQLSQEVKLVAKSYYSEKKRNIVIYCVEAIIALTFAVFAFIPRYTMDDVKGYISSGDYSQAEICLDKVMERQEHYKYIDTYSEFLTLCVVKMCENEEFDKASIFIHSKQGKLQNFSSYSGKAKVTMQNLEKIICEYQGIPYTGPDDKNDDTD